MQLLAANAHPEKRMGFGDFVYFCSIKHLFLGGVGFWPHLQLTASRASVWDGAMKNT